MIKNILITRSKQKSLYSKVMKYIIKYSFHINDSYNDTSEEQSLEVVELIKEAFQGYQTEEAKIPFSDLIEFMQIGYDESRLSRAIACREIESFKPITGVVIVDIVDDGFILRSIFS